MDIIDSELRRYDQWREDMEKRRHHFENSTGLTFFSSGNDNSDKKTKIIDDIWNTDSPLDYEIKKRSNELANTVTEGDIKKLKEELERSRKKFKSLTKKQEQLLRSNMILHFVTYTLHYITYIVNILEMLHTNLYYSGLLFITKYR